MKTRILFISVIFFITGIVKLYAQPFTEVNFGLNKSTSIMHFVDIDKDGDLDIPIDSIWINNGGTFTKTFFGLAGVVGDWGDYDNDGDMDVICGTQLYRNDGSIFTNVNIGLPSLSSPFSLWGDYDNDGQLDLAIMGSNGPSQYSYIYHNNNGVFTNINANIGAVTSGYAAWGDYDKDGDLDLLFEGGDYAGYNQSARIYRNNNGIFTNINAGLTIGMNNEPCLWVDYDNDGDLDVALENKIYRNNNGVFTSITTSFINYPMGLCNGDYDNDGDHDFVLLNLSDGTKIYRNNSGSTFTDIAAGITFTGLMMGAGGSTVSLTTMGDYDNDGNLDLLVSGMKGSNYLTRLYRNDNSTVNTIPNAPNGLVSTTNGNDVTFKWNRATDNETPALGLSYNIFIGTAPGVSDLYPAHANLATGKRYIPFRGMIQDTTITIHLNNLNACTNYYWSVQAIDAGYEGSAFATVQSFQLPLQANAGSDIAITCGESTQLNVTTNYGGSLTYNWSNGSSLSGATLSNPIATPESTTLYIVTVTDGISCTDIDTLNVTVLGLEVNAGSDLTFNCGTSAQLNTTINSGSTSISYSWTPTTNLNNAAIHNPVASPSDTTYYIVEATDGTSCIDRDTIRVVPTLANLTYPGICMVGIDQVLNKNLVIWEKPLSVLLSDFVIYRETTQAGVYSALDTIPYIYESIFIDTASYPNQMAYRYKIASLDICGNKSTLSTPHKTIHLTINQGAGTNWNLIWSPYEGFTFPTYNIYRGTNASSMFLIAQVQSNLFSFSNDPGAGTYYYQIEAVNPTPCNTGSKTIYSNTKSNIVNTIITNINNNENNPKISIFPNPAKGKINISLGKISKETQVSIFDLQGKQILNNLFRNQNMLELVVNDLTEGIYLVRIKTENTVVNKKLIIQ